MQFKVHYKEDLFVIWRIHEPQLDNSHISGSYVKVTQSWQTLYELMGYAVYEILRPEYWSG